MWGLFVGFRALPRRQSIWGVEESSPNLRDRDVEEGTSSGTDRPPTTWAEDCRDRTARGADSR